MVDSLAPRSRFPFEITTAFLTPKEVRKFQKLWKRYNPRDGVLEFLRNINYAQRLREYISEAGCDPDNSSLPDQIEIDANGSLDFRKYYATDGRYDPQEFARRGGYSGTWAQDSVIRDMYGDYETFESNWPD